MLKQRVITALIMMAVFLGFLFLAPWSVFVCGISVLFLVGAWEWAKLCGFKASWQRLSYVCLLVVIACGLLLFSDYAQSPSVLYPVLLLACLWWAVAFVWVRVFPVGENLVRLSSVRAIMGCFVLLPSWLAVVYLIQLSNGAMVVLLGLLTVAAVDVGAYFSGKRFGKRKLSPVVSPGKSWEGVWGGLVLAILVALLFVAVFGDLNGLGLLVVILPAALISVVGDLLESMMKRVHGVKDSGSILPGHGGVLDRIDGLASAIPVFAFAILSSGWAL